MKIKQKLLFSFLSLSLLTLGVSHFTKFVIEDEARTNFQEIGGEIMPGNVALARMTTELYHILELVRRFSEEKDSRHEEEVRQALSILSTYKTMHMLYHSAQDEWDSEIEETVEKFSSHITEYLLLLKKGSSKEELNAVSNKINILMDGFVTSVNPHIELEFRNGMQILEEAKKSSLKADRIFIIAGLAILAFTVLVSLLLSELIAKPIRNLRNAALEVGQGKLDVSLQSTSKDEIGELTTAFNDMTSNLSQVQEELLQAQKIEAIGTLAGGIAHDFNNILTGIFGYTELARLKVKNNPEVMGILDEVLNAGHRARNLVAQILTFSRKTEYTKLLLQPATIIMEALKLLRSSIPTTIEIKKNIQSHGAVLGDPTQIHQIIMNLCTNAYYSMRTTGGVLAVSLEEIDFTGNDYPSAEIEPGRYLRLEVSDTGTGMDAKTKEKIFEPYFTTREVGAGTGLGLAVVYGIVKNSRGHISVYSELGQGTTFNVYLPLVESEGLQLAESEIRAVDKHPQGGTERIMVIDDEETIVRYIRNALEEMGYRITGYTNGLQALQDFAKQPGDFDLVITDMTMPYMTGADLAQKILELKADMPIILCTGYSELINKEKAIAMGIAVYLQKPIAVNSLLGEIRNALDRLPQKHPQIPS